MIVFKWGTLIDGTGAAPVHDTAVVIRDGRVSDEALQGRDWLSAGAPVRSGPPSQGAAQQATGEGAGRLAFPEQDLAVHDRRRDTTATLHQSARAGRQVVRQLGHLGDDGVGGRRRRGRPPDPRG